MWRLPAVNSKIVAIGVSLLVFLSCVTRIYQNSIVFQSDEMYWIQTARILPYISEKKFASDYWHENMGFTNFNGAKWIYAIGLRIFGHTNYENIGIPPQTYYKWNIYDGTSFPQTHPLYRILQDGRIISAITASLAAGLFFLITSYLSKHMISSLFATLLLVTHSIFQTIALHALADSMFLLFQFAAYLVLIRVLSKQNRKNIYSWCLVLGGILGYFIGIKINAYMFFVLCVCTIIAAYYRNTVTRRECLMGISLVTISAIAIFLLIHPNLFFYPHYSLITMVTDRIEITQYHMRYFRSIDPSHVLDTVTSRLFSMYRNVYNPLLFVSFCLSMCALVIDRHAHKALLRNVYTLCLHMSSVIIFLLVYVVFDEKRYFMPLLPFLCILGSFWISAFMSYSRKLGRN